jgi:hypothetical protein
MNDAIRITPPPSREIAPAPVSTDAGWNWPLITRAARGIGAALFVFAVMWLISTLRVSIQGDGYGGHRVWLFSDYGYPSMLIAALGAGLFAVGTQRAIRPQ